MAEDFRQEPASARVAQGDTAVLRCLAPRGYPDPVTSWLRDGQPLAVGRWVTSSIELATKVHEVFTIALSQNLSRLLGVPL